MLSIKKKKKFDNFNIKKVKHCRKYSLCASVMCGGYNSSRNVTFSFKMDIYLYIFYVGKN